MPTMIFKGKVLVHAKMYMFYIIAEASRSLTMWRMTE